MCYGEYLEKLKKCTTMNCYLRLQINLKSWNIINNEIGTASSKKFTQTEFKLGNKTPEGNTNQI